MQLDFVPGTGAFVLRVPRSNASLVSEIVRDHGLDLSLPASTNQTAVLFTREPYAAVAFEKYGTPKAKEVLHAITKEIEASWALDCDARFACPADKELWGFQRADLAYALRRQNTLVGDQPGLGKTPIAICFANEIKAKSNLVICPASLRLQWEKRIREWTTLRWPYTVHNILKSNHGVHPNAAWTIVSYELAAHPAIGAALAKRHFDCLIADEAHYLKSIDARRTQAIFGGGTKHEFPPLASKTERILALTGTPLPNRPREAYTIARGLHWDAIDWLSEDRFKERFNPSLRGEKIDPATGKKKIYIDERTGRHHELQARLRHNFMTRHLKRDVMPQLKMPVYDVIQVEETEQIKLALEAESLLHIDPEQFADNGFVVNGDISTVRKMMGVAMAPQVADYADTILDGGEEKLVIFAWHIEVLNILQERLAKWGVLRVDGSTGAARKDKIVEQFIADDRKHVIIGNILSLGTGTDGLQKVCNHAIIGEPDWVPGNNVQAFDRLDRGGQTRTVQGDILVAPGSFAEKILGAALRKMQVTHKALDRRL